MNRKRALTVLAVICTVLCLTALLAACGKNNPSKPQTEASVTYSEEEKTQETQTAPEEAKPENDLPKTMYVNTEDGLLLRKGPGKKNDVVHLLSYGQEIVVEKTENGWAYTTVDGKTGWCSMEYLTENKDEIKTKKDNTSSSFDPNKLVTPTNDAEQGFHGHVNSPEGVNLRYGPGQQYGIITAIPNKTDLVELGWEDGWVYTEYKGKKGWISAEYFMMEGGKEKPVIYLYPTRTMDVNVRITLTSGEFTQSIPAGDGEWNVTAEPDGTLTDKASGEKYGYIFWESTDETEYDWSEGYVVKGHEAKEFLNSVLPQMGLSSSESAEFIEYWLPRLGKNEYNLVSFQTDCYTDSAKLDVSPQPDSVLRVFMAFKKIDGPVFVSSPKIEPFERQGFTVVEWGGTEVH